VAYLNPLALTGLGAVAFGAAFTALVRHLALRHAVLDVPNDRSLHAVPTPRGGGLAIVAVALLAISLAGWRGLLPPGATIGLLGGGFLVAAVGWLDDLRSLPVRIRATAHVAAAAWFLYHTGGLPTIRVGEVSVTLGAAGAVLALLGIVWSVNLYNFMDGIDGLAGGQAVLTAGIGALLFMPGQAGLALVAIAVAGASAGFLVWNWAPARIFMGDAGSGLLGFVFATLGLLSERTGAAPLFSWGLLGAIFLFDATLTLVRRALRGERWHSGHRSHAYQRAVQSGWSHARVTIGALLLSVLVGGLGVLAAERPELLGPAAGLALLLLGAVYLLIERRLPMGASPRA